MIKTLLTIGLFDKDTKTQKISAADAVNLISNIILDAGIFGATIIPNCTGIYKMNSDGDIIKEPSIRVEYAEDVVHGDISFKMMIDELKTALNQESIMVEVVNADISFM